MFYGESRSVRKLVLYLSNFCSIDFGLNFEKDAEVNESF